MIRTNATLDFFTLKRLTCLGVARNWDDVADQVEASYSETTSPNVSDVSRMEMLEKHWSGFHIMGTGHWPTTENYRQERS